MHSVHLFYCGRMQIQHNVNIIMPGKRSDALHVFWVISVNSAVNIIIVKHSTGSQSFNELN